MRLTNLMKKKWLVWAGGALLVATIISLGIVQIQQTSEKSSLSEELETAEKILSVFEKGEPTFWQDEIKNQLDETLTSTDTARVELSQPTDSITANETLFNIAEASSVTLTTITVLPVYIEALAELPCYLLPLNIAAEGELPALLNFITSLNTDLPNGVVRSATLTVSEKDGEHVSAADVAVIIYTYQGDSNGQKGSLSIY